MSKIGKFYLMIAAGIVASVAAVWTFTFGETNAAHMAGAARILTMDQCMKCHSAASMKPISICLDNHCLYTGNHSLMHPYPPPGKEGRFAPVLAIEQAGCILEDGRITCLSCHDLTKPPPHLIREGDELCFICHTHLKPW